MGNSHSQSHPHHQKHHTPSSGGFRYPYPNYPYPDPDGGWTHTHSLESPHDRNRMKRGYFPRSYNSSHLPPPQKVLPVPIAAPNRILKATSNGAILHGGGTISGRKLSELELDLNQKNRESNGNVGRNGRSVSTASCPCPQQQVASGRSTPNLLFPRMGVGGFGKSGSSSSSRSRDYGSEPDLRVAVENELREDSPDEPDGSPVPNTFTLIQESPAKKQIRSRKKSKAPPPPEFQQQVFNQQYCLQQNSQRQLVLTPVICNTSGNSNVPDFSNISNNNNNKKGRLFKTKAETKAIHHSPALKGKEKELNNIPSGKSQAPKPKQEMKGKSSEDQRKTFYFGMDAPGTFKQKKESTSEASENRMVSDLHKEISRRKMLQKIEQGDEASRASSRNSEKGRKGEVNDAKHNGIGKNKIPQSQSESDSDGIHRRQDSGSFDINEKVNQKVNAVKSSKVSNLAVPASNGNAKGRKGRESSSDLSSSELDVPLVVTRPTLPQKRLELPRFSPTSAWRAIESPSRGSNNSGTGPSLTLDIDSSEEGRLSRFTRPSAPPRISAERSGDSGISAGDAGSPAGQIPLLEEDEEDQPRNSLKKQFKLGKPSSTKKGADRMMKCWTPEQDLDESSSDFDQDSDPLPPAPPPKPSSTSSKLFEGKRASAVVSDSDSKYFRALESSEGKKGNYRKGKFNKASSNSGFSRLDQNWYLSRSEPNSLNYIGLFPEARKELEEVECELSFEEEFSSDNNNSKLKDIGYGPTCAQKEEKVAGMEIGFDSEEELRSDLFDYLDQYEEGEFEREQEEGLLQGGNLPLEKKKDKSESEQKFEKFEIDNSHKSFSHQVMYLPSYDSRRAWNQRNQSNWRRTRSVDHLDAQPLFQSSSKNERIIPIKVMDRKSSEGHSAGHVTKISVTPLRNESDMDEEERERRERNKKKFKFQSTLRLQERKKMEEQLTREAQLKEQARLREIEEMKRVEEEFQKKRRLQALKKEEEVSISGKKVSGNFSNFGPIFPPKEAPPPPEPVMVKATVHQSHSKMMSQRQEPEGAPAGPDLRRELISASKKRSGNLDRTQELSELREERRQYCDYRRDHRRGQASSPARFMQKASSISDIFPMRRRKGPSSTGSHSKLSSSGRSVATGVPVPATVHPQVVCDIPVKPLPYMVNASRLTGSTSYLATEDRPSTVVGSGSVQNLNSGPSSPSVHSSDNYRRDWAHHLTRNGQAQPRANSVMSLHSAPDNFRNSASDLSRRNVSPSPHRFSRENGNRPSGQHFSHLTSASPHPPSSSPVPSSNTDSFNQMSEKSSGRESPCRVVSSKTNTTVISIGPQWPVKRKISSSSSKRSVSTSNFQPQPFSGRGKGYRPVEFKIPPSPRSTTVVK